MKRTVVATILLALSLGGVVAAVDLTREHYLVLTDPEHESWCTVEDTAFDCARVARSRWSEHDIGLFRYPMPTAIPPMGFFTAFGVLAFLGWRRRGSEGYPAQTARDDTLAFAWLLLLPAACVDLLLIYVMKFQLRSWCIVCLGIDVTTLALLLLTPLLRAGGYRGLFRSGLSGMLRHGNWAVAAVVFVAVVAAGQRLYAGQIDQALAGARAQFAAEFRASEPVEGLLTGNEEHRGTPGAPFQVVEFADFQCPYCAGAALDIHSLMEAYPELIDFVFKHYPLSTSCNPFISNDMHPDACLGSYAVECARGYGMYWEMYDAMWGLFAKANAEGVRAGTEDVRQVAHLLELPATEFYYCLDGGVQHTGDVYAAVVADVATGKQVGVHGTPAVFVNGVSLPGGASAPMLLEWLLRDHLQTAGEPLPPPVLFEE